jgi:3-dehydroquinate dehydratase II
VRFLILHGPNLDRLGARQPEIYGSETLDEVNAGIEKVAGELGVEIEIHQTAREGGIVELLHEATDRIDGAIVNPAAYSHTSRAIAEAIATVPYPVVEVHISNIHAREPWRRTSVTAENAVGVIAGLGGGGYEAALRWLARDNKRAGSAGREDKGAGL